MSDEAGYMRTLDLMSEGIAWLASMAFFAVGLMLGYEVVARYFFNAPTIWAEELARLFMVWAVFAGSSSLIRNNEHIRVTILTDRFGPGVRRTLDLVSLVFVLAMAAFVAWYGTPIALDSLERGRTTGSMLDIPSWWMQASVPVGFFLMVVQCCIRAMRLIAPIDGQATISDGR